MHRSQPALYPGDINPLPPLNMDNLPRDTEPRMSTTISEASTEPALGDSAKHRRRREGSPKQRMREASKKKKAARACFHCQKAHLTCDDARPCQRCLKRGMADTCVEGVRKKAKYLLDAEELAELKRQKQEGKHHGPSESPATDGPMDPMTPYGTQRDDPLNNLSLNTTYAFDSHAANLEYSILSAILGNPHTDHPGAISPVASTTPSYQESIWSSSGGYPSINMPYTPLPADSGMVPPMSSVPLMSQEYAVPPMTRTDSHDAGSGGVPFMTPPSVVGQYTVSSPSSLSHRTPGGTSVTTPPANESPRGPELPIMSDAPKNGASSGSEARPAAVYRTVTKPYDYREGFHFLMKHLKERFVKNDILRIIRALAILRPSLIALLMPLSEEDEVFVEKCLQRSLLELEKLIAFNGTPTVVWRRTGEICVVGVEFSVLTGWTREELVGRGKFIYELFESQSAVEYWEKFASHAFENATQSVHSHCVLLTRTGAPILCAFCFSIRRDIFDLPNIIIGQWLPLLS